MRPIVYLLLVLLLGALLCLTTCGGGGPTPDPNPNPVPDPIPDPDPDPDPTPDPDPDPTPDPDPGLTLQGHIRGTSGAGLSNAAVLLGSNMRSTAADGSFQYSGLPAGRYVLSFQDQDGHFDCREVLLSSTVTDFNFILPTSGDELHAVGVSPQLNAANAALNSKLEIEFSEPPDPASVSVADFTVLPDLGKLTLSVVGTSVVLVQGEQAPLNQVVSIELTGEISDLNGAPMTRPLRWRFRTATSDTFPPELVITEPASGATGHPPNLPVTFIFNELLAPLDGSFSLSTSATAELTATVSGNNLDVLPNGGWLFNTEYSVTVSGLADQLGNLGTASHTVTFTTGDQPRNFTNQQPDWNRTLDVIVFASNRLGNFDVYSIKPDGTELTQLTNLPGDELHPTMNAEGTLLAYQARGEENRWNIYVLGLEGGVEPLQVTSGAFNDTEPCFSRTFSDEIVYVSDETSPVGLFQAFSDGTGVRELDNGFGSSQRSPALHPLLDGQVLFVSPSGGASNIWRKTISVIDGTAVNQNLTDEILSNQHSPAWGADASYFIYISNWDGTDNLWLADASGEVPRQVSYLTSAVSDPAPAPLSGDNRCVATVEAAGGGKELAIFDLVSGEIELYLTGQEAGN